MRIGIAISRYRRSGGLERVSGEWARGLARKGHDVTVFTQIAEKGPGDESISFVRVKGLRSPIAARAATFPPSATKAVGRAELDAIISFGCTVNQPGVIVRLPGAHRPWWELANSIAPVTTYEGLRRRMNPHHRIVLAWENRILRPSVVRSVLAASDNAAGDIARLYPRIAQRLRVVPDGIDLDLFSFDASKRAAVRDAWGTAEAFVIFTVATEVRRKGITTLLEAFTRVLYRRPDAVLVIAGTASRDAIEALAIERGLSDRVRAVGFVDDLPAAYAAADLMVFPTIFDPWGLPVVESLACGTPVVTTTAAGSCQVVVHDETGVILDPTDNPDALAFAIATAASLPLDRARNRDSVAHLVWPNIVEMVESVLGA